MVLDLGSAFTKRQEKFCGNGDDEVFLDAFEFRQHLNEFFGCGRTVYVERPVHWYFLHRVGRREVPYDSISKGWQCGDTDMHCTLYSLYSEVMKSKYAEKYLLDANGIKLRLRELRASKANQLHNLYVLYYMLYNLCSDSNFKKHVHRFEPWRRWGDYLDDLDYAKTAWDQVKLIRRLRSKSAQARSRRT